MLHAVAAVVIIILYSRWWFWAPCVAPESCRIFPRDKNSDYETWRDILSGIGEDPH